ncbi:MAG: hypothetical protein WAL75_01660 [Terracidiphilus sp.]
MLKKSVPFVLPHLTPEEISDRDYEELRLSRELSKCSHGSNFDSERAFHVLRAHAVEIFNVVYPAYRKKTGFGPKWISEIVRDVAYRTLRVYSVEDSYGTMPTINELFNVLFDTLDARLEELKGTEAHNETASIPTLGAGFQTVDLTQRIALRNAYRAAFPDVKIADIIWAAKQTRREWTRWISGEAKDGLRPDRSFKHVLTSGKTPEQIMGKPRPTKYNS